MTWFKTLVVDLLDDIQRDQRKGHRKIMAALDDLKAGQVALKQAVADVVAALKALAGQVTGGVSAADAESVAQDITTQAAALEAAIAPVPPPPPPPPPTQVG